MKKQILLLTMLAIFGLSNAFATKIIVDINGAGQYTSIQAGINAAAVNDTVIVWPGTYFEQVTLNKVIVLQGSGYENTIITGNFNPAVTVSSGIIKWFMVSSTAGNGISFSGGAISNCVIKGCGNYGIYATTNTTTAIIANCVITQNGIDGIHKTGTGSTFVFNCISRLNNSYGYRGDNGNYNLYLSYSCGSSTYVSNLQGCIDTDPLFTSTYDYHIPSGSPCYNTGQPSLADPDGSRSDMGYFGGPDCPIYPVVYEMTVSPNGNNINIQAKARANY